MLQRSSLQKRGLICSFCLVKLIHRCWSFVGKFGGAQILSLEPPDEKGPNCLENEGKVIHELMHALGIFHEHSRADRDMYIDIHYENIIPGKLTFRNYNNCNTNSTYIIIIIILRAQKLHNHISYILCEDNIYFSLSIIFPLGFRSNFNKQSPENATYSYEYGYDSIMHYGSYFFSTDPTKPTLTPKTPGVMIGQRKAMSKTDCLKLNDLYGCLDKSEQARMYYNICKTLGL